MNEGEKILESSIKAYREKINNLLKTNIIYDDVDLYKLYLDINNKPSSLSKVSNNLIDTIIRENNYGTHIIFKKKITQLRDMYIGSEDYDLKININDNFDNILNTFKELLKNIINRDVPGLIDAKDDENKLNELQSEINNNEIIIDTDFINKIVSSYDSNSYDNNIIKVMNYIGIYNASLVSSSTNIDNIDINSIKIEEIDPKVLDVLKKCEIDITNIPNNLLSDLKDSNVSDIINVYELIRKNKAEDYGILHLINRSNQINKLVILLYASDESIKGVIDSLRDNNGDLNIKLLKIIINECIQAFIIKDNNNFEPKYDDFINNIMLLKTLNIDIDNLVNREPLFMISSNEIINYTLNYLEKYGASKKKIINKCYKTLTINSSLLITNIDLLKKYNVDFTEFFGNNNANYNLLKVTDLDKKLNYVIKNNNINGEHLDYDKVSKLIIDKVFDDIKNNKIPWGDIND